MYRALSSSWNNCSSHDAAEVMDRRRESVEHPFGSIKQWMGQGAFLTRRLAKVRGEFSLTALAYNLRCAINLVGIPALTAVVAR